MAMPRSLFNIVIFLGLNACASTPLDLKSCYLGVVDKENDSYAQLCFAEPPDSRGELLFYTRNTKFNVQGKREAVCKQKFDSVTKAGKIYLKPKIAKCGSRNSKEGPIRGVAITGVSFHADIDYCWFTDSLLMCKEQGSQDQLEFRRVGSK